MVLVYAKQKNLIAQNKREARDISWLWHCSETGVELLIIDSSVILRMAKERARPVKFADIQSHCKDAADRTWKGPIPALTIICCGIMCPEEIQP